MTNKYAVTLSDGVTQFFVYELEQDGPGNVSTPRQIRNINLAGGPGSNYFELAGDLTYRFVPGFTFSVVGNAAGTYIVAPSGSTYSGSPGTTMIPVVQTISSSALPYGSITYTIPSSTSLLLSGSGVRNYGQSLNTNLVHMLENFAGTTPPVSPLVGQVWFDTSINALKVWNGSTFTAGVNVDTFSVRFLDPQNPNGTATIVLTGNETTYPDTGLTLRTLTNPNAGNSIFRVLSADGIEYLRVEYNGHVTTASAFKQNSSTIANEFSSDIVFANSKGIKSAAGSAIRTDSSGATWQVTGDINADDTLYVDSTNHLVGIGGSPVVGGSPAITNILQIFGSSTIAGTVDMQTHRILNVSAPINAQDAANKDYVDVALSNLMATLDVKLSVRVATTTGLSYVAAGNGVGKTLTATSNGALVIDGVAVGYADRILVKNETGFAGSNNGIYVVTQPGSEATPFILTRANDADQNTEITPGMIVIVQEGTVNGDTGWILTTNSPIVVDTTELTFTRFGSVPSAPQYDTQVALGSPTSAYTTGFNFSTAPTGKATVMVFVNGVKQIEGASKAYTITAPTTVTFNSGHLPAAGANIDFYGFG